MTSHDTTHGRRAPTGALLLLSAAVLWSSNGLFVKFLHAADVGGWGIAGFRSLFACLFLTPFAVRRLRPIKDKVWVIAAVLVFTAMCATFVNAMTQTTVANAIVLQYTAPAWVFLFSPFITRERAGAPQLVSLIFSLTGVAVIFAWQYETGQAGLVLGLASGLVFGVQTVLFRRVRFVDPLVMVWLACGGSAVVLLPVSFAVEGPVVTVSLLGWLALMGLVQFAAPYVLYCIGLSRLPAQQAALLILLEPILSPLWVWLAMGEMPHVSTLVGGGFIMGSVLYLTLHQLARTVRDRTPDE